MRNSSESKVKITGMPIVLFNFEGPLYRRKLKRDSRAEKDGTNGGIAQLGEHLLCKQGVNGSIPFISTKGLKDLSRNQYGLIAQPVRAHA